MAELLIVVAIIAVLVAVAIPVFNAQLEKANQSVNLANARSMYANAVTKAMADDMADGTYDSDMSAKVKQGGFGEDPSFLKNTDLPNVGNDFRVHIRVANRQITNSWVADTEPTIANPDPGNIDPSPSSGD